MRTQLLPTVVLAQNYSALRDWYVEVFTLAIIKEFTADYHYCELGQNGQTLLAITSAKEMQHTATEPKNNSVALQFHVSSIEALFQAIESDNLQTQGPFTDQKEGFKFGSCTDIEGNQIWLMENYLK